MIIIYQLFVYAIIISISGKSLSWIARSICLMQVVGTKRFTCLESPQGFIPDRLNLELDLFPFTIRWLIITPDFVNLFKSSIILSLTYNLKCVDLSTYFLIVCLIFPVLTFANLLTLLSSYIRRGQKCYTYILEIFGSLTKVNFFLLAKCLPLS